MITKEQKWLEFKKWVLGTIFTAVLPFLSALYCMAADDFKNNYLEYFPYIDSLLLLYSVALNCYVLTKESEGVHKNRVVEFITKAFSFSLAASGALFYMFLMGREKNEFHFGIIIFIMIATIINFAFGTMYIFCNYKNGNNISRDDVQNKEYKDLDNNITACNNTEKKGTRNEKDI